MKSTKYYSFSILFKLYLSKIEHLIIVFYLKTEKFWFIFLNKIEINDTIGSSS